MRQIILDTETTGFARKPKDPEDGHRIIEIGAVEIIDRRVTANDYQTYLNPERQIDPASIPVHGITDDYVSDKPKFSEVINEFIDFIQGAEVIMHNASFDVGFINQELKLLGYEDRLGDICQITDSLLIAREKHPRQRNSLDALCSRYGVDTASRELHGALIDAKLLANVYLSMTGGQASFFDTSYEEVQDNFTKHEFDFSKRKIIAVNSDELEIKAHKDYLERLSKTSKKDLKW